MCIILQIHVYLITVDTTRRSRSNSHQSPSPAIVLRRHTSPIPAKRAKYSIQQSVNKSVPDQKKSSVSSKPSSNNLRPTVATPKLSHTKTNSSKVVLKNTSAKSKRIVSLISKRAVRESNCRKKQNLGSRGSHQAAGSSGNSEVSHNLQQVRRSLRAGPEHFTMPAPKDKKKREKG